MEFRLIIINGLIIKIEGDNNFFRFILVYIVI